MWGDETRGRSRSSLRISAPDAWTEFDSGGDLLNQEGGSPSQTKRINIKRHRDGLPIKQASQVGDIPHHEDDSTSGSKASVMPEKQVLELILDTLQRRDTYEIFAEPVDPNEVEDYYKIIKEPMDFGTMRAKLHEGMYENLDQFKHDVFLIARNAMHFNSSATIYFRQARAIHELAKRVFRVLQTDPEKFELEFSGTRRRSTRRTENEAKNSRFSTDVQPRSVMTNVSSKNTPFSVSKSVPRRHSRRSPKLATAVSLTNQNSCELSSGARDGRRSNNIEISRRCTYKLQNCSFLFGIDPVGSKRLDSKPLLLTNQQDVNYRESLLQFVKDLGSTAQEIATQKTQRLQESSPSHQTLGFSSWTLAPKYQVSDAYATSLSGSNTLSSDPVRINAFQKFRGSHSRRGSVKETTAHIMDLSNAEEVKEAYGRKRMNRHAALDEETIDYTEASSLLNGMYNRSSAAGRQRFIQNRKSTEFCSASISTDASARNLNSSIASTKSTSLIVDAGKSEENVLPVVLALEQCNSTSLESKSRNKKSSAPSTWLTRSKASTSQINGSTTNSIGSSSQTMCTKTLAQNDGVNNLAQARQSLAPQKTIPPVSRFTFDMCFLKAQLNQMNVVAREREREQAKARFWTSLDSEKLLFEPGGYSCNRLSESKFSNKESWSPLDSLDTELALQL